jgi:hypothetical protein
MQLVADAVMSERDFDADAFLIADQSGKQLTYLPLTDALPERLRH